MQDDCGLFFLQVDIQQFRKVCGVEEFYAALEIAPKEALLCMGAAVHMVYLCLSLVCISLMIH